MIPIVGVSLEEALLGFGGDDDAELHDKEVTQNGIYLPSDDGWDGYSKVTVNVPPTPITLDYILNNGHALCAEPVQIAKDTELEQTLAGYSVNFYMLNVGDEIGYINHVYGNIGSEPKELKDSYISTNYNRYEIYNVFYLNGEPLWAQELYVTDGNRQEEDYSHYTWGTPLSEYAKQERHFTDWDYIVLKSYESLLNTETLFSGIFEPTFNISYMSGGYIMIGLRKIGTTDFYAQFPRIQKYYSYEFDYTVDPPYKLQNIRTNEGTFNVSFYIRFPWDNTYSYAKYKRVSDLTKSELDEIIEDISARIYLYYQSTR